METCSSFDIFEDNLISQFRVEISQSISGAEIHHFFIHFLLNNFTSKAEYVCSHPCKTVDSLRFRWEVGPGQGVWLYHYRDEMNSRKRWHYRYDCNVI